MDERRQHLRGVGVGGTWSLDALNAHTRPQLAPLSGPMLLCFPPSTQASQLLFSEPAWSLPTATASDQSGLRVSAVTPDNAPGPPFRSFPHSFNQQTRIEGLPRVPFQANRACINNDNRQGRLGGSAVERLPLVQGVISESQDRVPHRAPCREPASLSVCVS